jgi:ribosomal protein L11 methyltransferase
MLYKLSLITYFYQKNYFESFLEGVTDNVCSFEVGVTEDIEPQKMDKWIVEAYFEEKPEDIIISRLKNYAELNQLMLEKPAIIEVEEEDFVSKVMMDFKPIITGNFYIHNSYYKVNEYNNNDHEDKHNLIHLHIDSGMAFGTGDHETTSVCLQLL